MRKLHDHRKSEEVTVGITKDIMRPVQMSVTEDNTTVRGRLETLETMLSVLMDSVIAPVLERVENLTTAPWEPRLPQIVELQMLQQLLKEHRAAVDQAVGVEHGLMYQVTLSHPLQNRIDAYKAGLPASDA